MNRNALNGRLRCSKLKTQKKCSVVGFWPSDCSTAAFRVGLWLRAWVHVRWRVSVMCGWWMIDGLGEDETATLEATATSCRRARSSTSFNAAPQPALRRPVRLRILTRGGLRSAHHQRLTNGSQTPDPARHPQRRGSGDRGYRYGDGAATTTEVSYCAARTVSSGRLRCAVNQWGVRSDRRWHHYRRRPSVSGRRAHVDVVQRLRRRTTQSGRRLTSTPGPAPGPDQPIDGHVEKSLWRRPLFLHHLLSIPRLGVLSITLTLLSYPFLLPIRKLAHSRQLL